MTNKNIYGQPIRCQAIGYCHNKNHKGQLTPKLMKKHECVKKGCRYLDKNLEHPYWRKKEKKKVEKKKRKKQMESKIKNAERTKKKKDKNKEYLNSLKKEKLIALIEQYRWEKDIALSQLKDLNLELGEKTYLKAISVEYIKNYAQQSKEQKEKEYLLKMLKDYQKQSRKETNG